MDFLCCSEISEIYVQVKMQAIYVFTCYLKLLVEVALICADLWHTQKTC